MQLYNFTIAGIAAPSQSDAGKLREFYWCAAYNEKQALAWAARHAEHRGEVFLTDLRVVKMVERD